MEINLKSLKCTIQGKAFSMKNAQNTVQVPRVQSQENGSICEEGRL